MAKTKDVRPLTFVAWFVQLSWVGFILIYISVCVWEPHPKYIYNTPLLIFSIVLLLIPFFSITITYFLLYIHHREYKHLPNLLPKEQHVLIALLIQFSYIILFSWWLTNTFWTPSLILYNMIGVIGFLFFITGIIAISIKYFQEKKSKNP